MKKSRISIFIVCFLLVAVSIGAGPLSAFASTIVYQQLDHSTNIATVNVSQNPPPNLGPYTMTSSLDNANPVYMALYGQETSGLNRCDTLGSGCRTVLENSSFTECSEHALTSGERAAVNAGMALVNVQLEIELNHCTFSSGDTFYVGWAGGHNDDNFHTLGDSSNHAFAIVSTASITPPPPPVPHIDSFSIGTSTATVTGYADSSGFGQYVQFLQNNDFGIRQSLISDISSTGNFTKTFPILDVSSFNTGTTTIYVLAPNEIFTADLYQRNQTVDYDIANGTSTPPTNIDFRTITSTSSSTDSNILDAQQYYDLTISTSTAPGDSSFLTYLNVPNLLQTKAPFSYIPQLKSLIYNALTSSSSDSIPVGPIVYKIPGQATTTLDFFSIATVRSLIPDTYFALLRNLMVAVTYFSTAWFIYHSIKHKRNLS